MSITLDTPEPGDAAALAGLKADTFVETYASGNDPEELAAHTARAFDPAAVAQQLSDRRCMTWWLLDDSRPVGYIKLNTGAAQTVEGLTDGLEIEQLYVRASHLGQGSGNLTLSRAKEAARELALGYLWLGAGSGTRGRSPSTSTSGSRPSTRMTSCWAVKGSETC